MKKFFRILVFAFINLMTLPVQIGIALFLVTSNLTKDEWSDINYFCEEGRQSNMTWIKTGRFPE